MSEKSTQPAAKTVQKIATELESAPEPLTVSALANRVGLSPTTTRKALVVLVSDERAVRNDDGLYVAVRTDEPTKPAKKTAAPKAKDDRKAKMLDTMADRDRQAVAIIRKAGFDGVSVDDLSKQLGITNGAGRVIRARLSEERSVVTAEGVRIESAGGGKWRLVGAKAKAKSPT